MKGSWTQPSLSRDFVLLSAAVIFLLFLISGWVTYTTYARYADTIAAELEKDGARTDRALAVQFENANYLLTSLGRQIVLDPGHDLVRLAQMLKSFDAKGNVYTLFSWDTPDEKMLVSSNRGILEKPVDMSDRDYLKKTGGDPWKMVVGAPVHGRVSDRRVIPLAMGLTDDTGKFIGTLVVSIDIDVLSDRIAAMVKHDGINVAIVEKNMDPVVQVSNDKDFISYTFPPDQLAHIDFSTSAGGLIKRGSLFWGTGTYGYYHLSQDYPYVVLLGYDLNRSNQTMRGQLWSRLLQVLLIAGFFVALLWVIRARMIRPVLDMTAIAAGVAKGEVCASLPDGGPVEIAALAAQIRRISEYIEENRRIEDELRDKMFRFKKAKEQAEMARRSKSEFLAYICHEMRTPINIIIGAAQVMKDQLYGPIENRKYRQYASDIYATGNLLLEVAQNVLMQSKAETGYLVLDEKPVEVQAAITKALQLLAEKMQAERINVNVRMQEPGLKLVADEFRLQQIIMNIVLYAFKGRPAGSTLTLEAKVAAENRDKTFFAITISADDGLPSAELIALAGRMMEASSRHLRTDDLPENDLGLELARILAALHGGVIVNRSLKNGMAIAVIFNGNRVRFAET